MPFTIDSSSGKKTVFRPDYLPREQALELQKHWGDATLKDVFERLPEQLPDSVKLAVFKRHLDDLFTHQYNGKTVPWNNGLKADSIIPKIPKGMPIINGHAHVAGSGFDIYQKPLHKRFQVMAFADTRNYNGYPFYYKNHNAYNHKNGIRKGSILVGQTVYRDINDSLTTSLSEAEGRAMGVASVPVTARENRIKMLHGFGVRGFRFTGVQRLVNPAEPFDIQKVSKFDHNLASYQLEGTNMNLYLESGDIVTHEQAIKDMENPVFLDHGAIPNVFDYQILGSTSGSLEALKRILRNNPKNMIKGPGPERIMMSNINAQIANRKTGDAAKDATAAKLRSELLDSADALNLSERVRTALDKDDVLNPKICGELATNPRVWDRYVLPMMKELIREFPTQFIFGTDAQHPNLTYAVDDGELVEFALRATEGRTQEETDYLRYRIFFANANEAYPGNQFRDDPNFIENPDESNEGGVYVHADPEQRVDSRALVI